jgi:phenylpyruvate tautomerase PptA (4-oxalocrotonate tautomerase family)
MAQLRLVAPPLPLEERRRLADELTQTTLRLVAAERREWIEIEFADVRPEQFARGGRLAADSGAPYVQLRYSGADMPLRTRRDVAAQLSVALAQAYGAHGRDVYAVSVRFDLFNPMTDFVIGFRFLGYFTPVMQRVKENAAPAIGAAFGVTGAALLACGLFRGIQKRAERRRVGDRQFREGLAVERDAALLEAVHEH